MRNEKINKMVVSAVMLGLATVLGMIQVIKMPLGGSVTLLCMLPICLLSIKYGIRWGVFCAFLFSVIQIALSIGELMAWGMTPTIWVGCLVFDYILAYTFLGLAGIFRKKGTNGIIIGITLVMLLRFLCHFISGVIFFDTWCPEGWNIYLYSISYNGAYMLPELIFTLIATVILVKTPHTQKIIFEK